MKESRWVYLFSGFGLARISREKLEENKKEPAVICWLLMDVHGGRCWVFEPPASLQCQ